ncbi:DUF397 domain-containing protein [Streptomyces fimicarius]|uniref:DUF397 domain-containing protein n=1 Tax=Streptomyces caviscabies TaxID=90079 RepID=A0ABW2MN20_9ACTN|nr:MULTISPECIES: DUF397 domain-containing protein [Streptomyces]MCL6290786.1 DUF397 domain-containing protein [Streptomyces sp. 43Y-GA-1]MDX2670929.1 DUF397 domain-containing protein [Streptomyces sp. NRRL_ISP-5395]MDX3341617.1 DUF397 domain-containing protein [Streptomyces sp. ME02-6979.5a]MDX3504611.1 DUF397 domain-containing protein [Streptomyces sp. ATCC51928]MDX3593863.1 DUF397 domain-containing protein [Streptomyces sp. ID03-2B]
MSDRLAPPVAPPPSSSVNPSAAQWRRSSRSTGMNNCVETARLGGALLAVRDSKDVDRPPLRFSAAAWTTFVTGLAPDGSGPDGTGPRHVS